MRTKFLNEIDVSLSSDTVLTQNPAIFQPESEKDVKFPKRIKFRGRVLATIYGKCQGRESYRVSWTVTGQRRMASFARYGEAKRHADQLVKELAKGSQATSLNPAQARDALAAMERLQSFYELTGRRVSLLAAASDYAEAAAKVNGRALSEIVEDYLRHIAAVKRMDIKQAVEEFVAGEEPKTKSKAGQRSQIAPAYFYNRAIRLRKFADTFPNTAICDLTKVHLDKFIGALGNLQTKSRNHRAIASAKTRNGYRAAVRQFLQWSVRKDYLAATHRLFEAAGFPEDFNKGRRHGAENKHPPKTWRAFCRTFDFATIDDGKIILTTMPQKFQTERRYVNTFLKLLFYSHALRRFDKPKEKRANDNLLILWADEAQRFMTASEDGMSDYNCVDVIREAGATIVAAAQSTTSLVPPLGSDKSKVLTLNLRNRIIFRSADEADAVQAADFLGKKQVVKRSWGSSAGKRSVNYPETEEHKIKPHKLRNLRDHECVLVHCEKGFQRLTLPPLESNGEVPKWFSMWMN